ncbi:uncharacterized protein LOC118428098 [Branchiostoma floridae]|uniref:Uncharacterized protein LOC118428098 n=1 Tax=Branchiostoma floridae TaxID=7739 RepID=C3ZEH1_BRAFL|nr:uncharacterized protein LOC118428098 [Branchiostoma floridae]|eukprot:XP_002593116.1 hypothetical protein BRAFLDRAFT_72809 [Branchiostoma floridae]
MASKMTASVEIAIPQSAEHIAPSWVQLVLQEDLPGITITEVDVKGSISEGEGFMSDIVAFDAVGTRNGTSQRFSLVAKMTDFKPLSVVWGGQYPESIRDVHIKMEACEVKFYSDVVPELLSVAVPSTERKPTSGNGDGKSLPFIDTSFLPKCYFAATDTSSMLSFRVMENLKTQGFSIKPNIQPLMSRAEMMLAVGALAQLHGLSHRLELLSGKSIPEKYDWIMTMSDTKGPMAEITYLYQTNVKKFAAAFPDQAELVARLEELSPRVIFKEDPRPRLKVLSHTDCWVNNIMIKYAGDAPAEVRLVDWQSLMYNPPTYDLAFLFVFNTGWDVFYNHRDAILAHYHRTLQETLGPGVSSGLRDYTLEELKADFKADCLYGITRRLSYPVSRPTDPNLLKMIQEIKEWGFI